MKLAGHFISDGAAQRSAADKVRPFRLKLANLFQIVRRHFCNGRVRFFAVQDAGLQCIKRLVLSQFKCEVVILEHVAANRMHTKKRWPRTLSLNRN